MHDVLPVVGWNDKLFALLCELVPPKLELPTASSREVSVAVQVAGHSAFFRETPAEMNVTSDAGDLLYALRKREPWASVTSPVLDVR